LSEPVVFKGDFVDDGRARHIGVAGQLLHHAADFAAVSMRRRTVFRASWLVSPFIVRT
jgi:hypothetical protein